MAAPTLVGVLECMSGALLCMFGPDQHVTQLRRVCKAACAAVSAHPWRTRMTVYATSALKWRACFPRARMVGVHGVWVDTAPFVLRDLPDPSIITEFVLSDQRNTTFGFEELLVGLRRTPNLTALTLHSVNLALFRTHNILCTLQHLPLLQKLDVSGNPFGSNVACILGEQLQHVPKLQVLHVSGCAILEDGLRALAVSCARHTPLLTTLDASFNECDAYTPNTIAALASLPKLISLNVSCAMPAAVESVPALLSQLRSLTMFKVDGHYYYMERVLWSESLRTGFVNLPHLLRVDIRAVPRVPAIAVALADMLRSMPQLLSFGVINCDLEDEDIDVLAAALAHVPELRVLSLSHNTCLSCLGITTLASHLWRVPKLTELDLEGCDLSYGGTRAIMRAAASLPCLTKVHAHVQRVPDMHSRYYKRWDVPRQSMPYNPHL